MPQIYAQSSAKQSITLKEVIKIAAQQSVDINIAKLDMENAELSQDLEGTPYIPSVSFGASYRDVYGTGNDSGSGSIALRSSIFWRSPIGTELRASLDTNHTTRGSTISPLSRLGFSISQDLLAGGWGSDNETDILSTESEISRMDFIVSMNAVLLSAARRYFELSTAQKNLKIAAASVKRAKQQFDDTAENIKRGLIAQGDIYVVEENLVFFEQQLLRAESQEIEASTNLASLLKMKVTTKFIINEELNSFSADEPTEKDFENHPALASRRLKLEQADKRLANARLNRLPSLSVVGGLGFNGISSPFGDALSETFSFQNPDATIGLAFSTPLSFSGKNAVVDRARIAWSKEKERQTQDELSIKEEVHNAAEQYRIRTKILSLANRRFKLSELKLETEVDKFKNGVSRLPEVVRFQRDVDTADFARTRALVDKNITILEWNAALGRLHEIFDVEIK